MTTKQWKDDEIAWYADNICVTAWEAKHMTDAMKRVRDDLTARITALEAFNKHLARRIAILEGEPVESEFSDGEDSNLNRSDRRPGESLAAYQARKAAGYA